MYSSELGALAYICLIFSIVITAMWLILLIFLFLDKKNFSNKKNETEKRQEISTFRITFSYSLLIIIWLLFCTMTTIQHSNNTLWFSLIELILSLIISAGMLYCLITKNKIKSNCCRNADKYLRCISIITSVFIFALDIYNYITISR